MAYRHIPTGLLAPHNTRETRTPPPPPASGRLGICRMLSRSRCIIFSRMVCAFFFLVFPSRPRTFTLCPSNPPLTLLLPAEGRGKGGRRGEGSSGIAEKWRVPKTSLARVVLGPLAFSHPPSLLSPPLSLSQRSMPGSARAFPSSTTARTTMMPSSIDALIG